MRDAFRGSLILAGLVAWAFLARYLSPSHTEEFVAYATEHHWLTNEFNESVARSMRAALIGTVYEDRWQINQPISAGGVNVYLVRVPPQVTDLPRDIARYRGAASYTGDDNAIVFDVATIDRLTKDLGLAPAQAAGENPFEFAARHEQQTKAARELLVFWIVGHELGHVVHHDKASHFSADAGGGVGGPQELPGGVDAYPQYNKAELRIEYAADKFFADQIERALGHQLVTQQQVNQLASQLMGVLNTGFYETVGPGARPVAGPFAFLTDTNLLSQLPVSDHPEFFLRAARLLTVLDHPQREFFADHVARFEQNLVKTPALTPALLIIQGTPSAEIHFKSDRISLQRGPVRLWLPPGDYEMEIKEEGFESQLKTVTLRAHQPAELTYQLAPDRKYKVQPTQEFSDAISRANASVDGAIRYEWIEPIPGAAEWELDRATRLLPTWSRPALLRAEIRLLQNRCDAAKSEWQTGLHLLPSESFEVRNRSAFVLLELADIEQALAQDPHDSDVVSRYLDHLWMLDRGTEATRFIGSLPDNLKNDSAVRLTTALLDRDRGDLQGALQILTRLVGERGGGDSDIVESARQSRAQVREELGQIQDAESDLTALSKDEHNTVLLAEFYERHGRADQAIALRRRILSESDPDEACDLVGLLISQGQKSEAMVVISERKLADTLHCRVLLGEDALRSHRVTEAVKLCDLSDPTSAINDAEDVRRVAACYARGLAARDSGAAAERAYRKALWFDPLNKQLREELAGIEGNLGQVALSACDRWMAGRIPD